MKKETLGSKIAALRKEQGMTQLELAQQMGVTDKAVSKWERDLSCPDISVFPRLAQIFHVTTDELMQVETVGSQQPAKEKLPQLIDLILKGVALTMGVAVVVLSWMGSVETTDAVPMLGLGLACLATAQLSQKGA